MKIFGVKLLVLAAAALMMTSCGSGADDLASGPDDTSDSDTSTSSPSTDAPVASTDPPVPSTDAPVPTTDAPVPTTDAPVPSTDPPVGGGDLPIVTLDITISHPDFDDVKYTISCLGDTATITGDDTGLDDLRACKRLGRQAVRKRLVQGPKKEFACTDQFGGPDVARIVGTYDGADGVPVDATANRINGCAIADWDDLLSGVLPRAVGVVQ